MIYTLKVAGGDASCRNKPAVCRQAYERPYDVLVIAGGKIVKHGSAIDLLVEAHNFGADRNAQMQRLANPLSWLQNQLPLLNDGAARSLAVG